MRRAGQGSGYAALAARRADQAGSGSSYSCAHCTARRSPALLSSVALGSALIQIGRGARVKRFVEVVRGAYGDQPPVRRATKELAAGTHHRKGDDSRATHPAGCGRRDVAGADGEERAGGQALDQSLWLLRCYLAPLEEPAHTSATR